MRTSLVFSTALVLLTGCVSQKQYDALKGERDGLETTLGEKNAALAELEKKQARAEKEIADLNAQLAEAKASLADLNTRIDKQASEMARVAKDKSRLQASIDDMTRALAELEKRRAQAEARVQEFKSLLARFRALIDAGKLKVKMVDGRMVVVLATDILFGSGSASLSKDGKVAIAEVAQVLSTIGRRNFQVEGHTDNVPIASAQYPSNWELAAGRAITVVKTMIEAGLPAERISAASFGDTRPTVANDSKENKAQNRRIEITIVPDLSSLPGFDELNSLDSAQ